MFELGPLVDTPVRQLSLGERMRCEIAASLLHAPRMLFLDEPTIGLDVSAKAAIRELLRTESERDGVTLLLTSHDTGDIERVCDRADRDPSRPAAVGRPDRGPAPQVSQGQARHAVERGRASRADAARRPRVVVSAPTGRSWSRARDHAARHVVDAALRQAAIRDLAIEDAPLDEVIRALYADAETGA